MKLAALLLARYGHLTDVVLRFPPGAGLHVVFGANEAGKSTALSAIGDALYGFPDRTPYAFQHERNELRIGFDVLGPEGAAQSFVRLKKRKEDLTDAAGRPLPEAALAALRGPHDRRFFENMFGLDAARLRAGGAAILDGRGEVGATIFQAASGLVSTPSALASLGREADALYTPRRAASRAFYQAIDAHKTARAEMLDRSLSGEDYARAQDRRKELTTTIAKSAERARALNAERQRRERVRRTLPALLAHDRAREELAALGQPPALPADAAILVPQARMQREVAAATLARERERRASIAESFADIQPDDTILREADAIDALARELPVIDATAGDRVTQQTIAEERARQILRLGRDLGLPADADAEAIVARIPTAAARNALRRAVTEHAKLSQRLLLAGEQHTTATHHATQAADALAALPPPPDPAALAHALAEARTDARIDTHCDETAAAIATAEAEVARALASLAPPWPGDAAALRAAPVPPPAALRRHEQALAEAETALRDATAEFTRAQQAQAAAQDELAALAAAGPLPTPEAIATARDRRDHAWRLLRRQHIEGGPPATEAERHDLPALPLPDALEELTREADRLADLRNEEAGRLEAWRLALGERERCAAACARAEAARAAAQVVRDAAAAAWRDAWAPCGLAPSEPAAMRDWLAARKEVLDRLAAAEDAGRSLAALEARRSHARESLARFLPDAAAGTRLAPLLRLAESHLAEQQEAARRHATAATTAANAARAEADATRALAAAGQAMAQWRDGWAGVLAAASLPAATAAEDAEAALSVWEQLATAAQEWGAARQRVADMTGAIAGFARRTADLVARAAPALAGEPAGAAASALAARLAAAREQAQRRAQAEHALQQADAEIARAQASHDDAERTLDALRRLAAAEDDAALDAAIDRQRRHAALQADIEAHAGLLQQQGDGLSLDQLRQEAAGEDHDALAARLAEIAEELARLDDTASAARQSLGTLDAELARMEAGRDAAAAAQRMANAAAEAAGITARYARLHLARTLLNAGLQRFRREQQAPMLRRAGELFARLTEGRHARLEVEEDDDGRHSIVAVTEAGRRCPVAALSEGTRDQLYLALRLAAIEDHCRHATALPLIADDLLVQFDDARARAALAVLGELASQQQIILFTHHRHIAAMVPAGLGHVQELP